MPAPSVGLPQPLRALAALLRLNSPETRPS
jgi:hypothetical protein